MRPPARLRARRTACARRHAGRAARPAPQAKAQRRWQSGRARLADCKAHVLPSYSASGLQFIGDPTCRSDALFDPGFGALTAGEQLAAAGALPGFCDAQHSLFGGGLFAGGAGALATSEAAACAQRCLSLPDFGAPVKLVRRPALLPTPGVRLRARPGAAWAAAAAERAADGAARRGAGHAQRLVCTRAVQQRRGPVLGPRAV